MSSSKLIIHNPCNEYTRFFRYYNLFWDQLTYELKKTFSIEESRYYEKAHSERSFIHLPNDHEMPIQECDYLIENLDTKEVILLSVSDMPDYSLLADSRGDCIKKFLIAQYSNDELLTTLGESYSDDTVQKCSPWIYFQAVVGDLEQHYFKRKYNPPTENTLFFKGDCGSRPIVDYFPANLISGPRTLTSTPDQYFTLAIQHKVGLSVGGRGEFCYRDVEYMAIGLPFIRFEYTQDLAIPLIPNVHYISIPRPDDMLLDRMGEKHHAEMILDRYQEVIDDEDFLQYISSNARQYYEEYLQYPNNIKHTINLMKINEWI